MAASLSETGVTTRHCVDLLAAFKQDARKSRYANWDELMGYCELSANPVGRYLLDLHGEDVSFYPASDGLCSALQVLNYLQDKRTSLRRRTRAEPSRAYTPGYTLEQSQGRIATGIAAYQIAVAVEELPNGSRPHQRLRTDAILNFAKALLD